ncbi:hypothetical protein [Pedobacter polaris]|uniref:hypothetical protein n=1 Tax=Pedobacter polaris TaxID=2571273 RepID=UPI0021D096C8|nr:hypothetical protein [Pedobacter polaris]
MERHGIPTAASKSFTNENLAEGFTALQCATADAGRIYFDGKYFREDIGFDLM